MNFFEKEGLKYTNFLISDVYTYHNNCIIEFLYDYIENENIKVVLFDRKERIEICNVEANVLAKNKIRFEVNSEVSDELWKESKLQNIRFALILETEEDQVYCFLKTKKDFLKERIISCCAQKGIKENKRRLLLYFSAGGLLSIKWDKKRNLVNREYESVCISADFNISHDKFEIHIPEEIKLSNPVLISMKTGNELVRLKAFNIKGCIQTGFWTKTEYNQNTMKTSLSVEDFCLFEKLELESVETVFIADLGAEKDVYYIIYDDKQKDNEHYCYDLQKRFMKPQKICDDKYIVPFKGNDGAAFTIVNKKFLYQNQTKNILRDYNIGENGIELKIKCRNLINVKGKYTGIILYNKELEKSYYIKADKVSEYENATFISLNILSDIPKQIFADGDLIEGNLLVYSIYNCDNCDYAIPVVVSDSNLMEKVEKKKTFDIDGMDFISRIGKKKTLFFASTIGKNAFKKPITEKDFETAVQSIGMITPNGEVESTILQIDNCKIKLKMYVPYHAIDKAAIVLIDTKTKNSVVVNIDISAIEDNWIDFQDQISEMKIGENRVYRAYILIEKKGKIFFLKLVNTLAKKDRVNIKEKFDRRDKYFDSLCDYDVNGQTYSIIPYYALNGLISIWNIKEEEKYTGQFSNAITAVRIRSNKLEMTAKCQKLDDDFRWKGFQLSYRAKREEDKAFIDIPYNVFKRNEDNDEMSASVDINSLDLKMIYWDIYCLFENNDRKYRVKCFCENSLIGDSYNKTGCKDYYVNKTEESILYPYMTKANAIALTYRNCYKEYDSLNFRFKERIALDLYHQHRKALENRNIYLIYEKYCTAAQDNAYYFFLYCMKNNVEKEIDGHIYYIIDKKSNDYKNIQMYDDHVIQFGSLKHMVYILASKLLISTDTKEHAYVYRAKGSIILPQILKKEYVFLQHGVTAFKKVDHVYAKGKFGECKKFVVTSDFEKNIVRKYFKYDPKDIIVTGFSRWDVLQDKSENHRKIMIVPTWRSWLDDVENDTFVNSEYFKRYMELLNAPRLYEILEKYDVTADFYIHIKFKDYIHNFDSRDNSRVRLIVFGEQPLNELMMECKLLITDYSSVSWDVFYQGKPVLFYQFDLDDYMYAHGSYMNLKEDMFGDRAEDMDSLLDLLEEYMESDFELKPKYAAQRAGYYKYIDDKNSQRIWNEIKKIALSDK